MNRAGSFRCRYKHAGLDLKSRDVAIHRDAMNALSAAIGIELPITRRSEFMLVQLERYLAIAHGPQQMTAA